MRDTGPELGGGHPVGHAGTVPNVKTVWRNSPIHLVVLALAIVVPACSHSTPPFTVTQRSTGDAGTTYLLKFNDRSPRLSVYLIEANGTTDDIWSGIGTAVPATSQTKASYSTSVPETDASTTKGSDVIVLPPELRRVPTRICVDFEPEVPGYDDRNGQCVQIKD